MMIKIMDDFLASIYRECRQGRALVLADDLERAIACGALALKPDSAAVTVLRALAILLRASGEEFDSVEVRDGTNEQTTMEGVSGF